MSVLPSRRHTPLALGLAAVLALLAAAAAMPWVASASDCPECDQYTLVIPDPRGGGDGGGGGADTPVPPEGFDGSGDPAGNEAAAAAATGSAPSAGTGGATADRKRGDRRERKRRGDRTAAEPAEEVVPSLPLQVDLDFERPSATQSAIAQLLNPFSLLVLAAMAAGLWLARRREEPTG